MDLFQKTNLRLRFFDHFLQFVFFLRVCQVDFCASPAKVQCVKPKVFLLCSVMIPAQSAVKLTKG